jgi:aminopeptidase N
VTVEDWVAALTAGSGVDLSNFLTWYNQPGTPKLEAEGEYDAVAQTYRLSFKQSLKAHPKYPNLKAVPIPVALALFNAATGEQYTLQALIYLKMRSKMVCIYLIKIKRVLSLAGLKQNLLCRYCVISQRLSIRI